MNSVLFCIVFCICIFEMFRSFSALTHGSRAYFFWVVQKRSCFCKEELSSLVIWATYFRCWILQNDEIFAVLVIVRRVSLSYKYAQSRPSGSGMIVPVFLASFLAFKYSGGHFSACSLYSPSSGGSYTRWTPIFGVHWQLAPMTGNCTKVGF